jgi:hypothetical protein
MTTYNLDLLREQLTKVGLYLESIDINGNPKYWNYPLNDHSTDGLVETGTAIILAHDPTGKSIRQQFQFDLNTMDTDIRSTPNWATWTPTEAQTNVTNLIFGGTDEATLDTQIDGITTIAQVRASLKQIVSAIIAIRTILSTMAKILVYFRKFIVDNDAVWK